MSRPRAELQNLTGPLNISLLACAAIPPGILGALERRAATPLTLSLSEKVAICVSVVLCTSRAAGGGMVRMVVAGAERGNMNDGILLNMREDRGHI